MSVRIEVVRSSRAPEPLPLPAYQTEGSAGMDLCADLAQPVRFAPMERKLVPTGLRIAVPPGYEAQVRPRSGLALKQGLTVANAPGTIDSDDRGEVQVILINLGTEAVTVSRGDRIAQLVICPVARATLAEVTTLDDTARGQGGFGSTGRA